MGKLSPKMGFEAQEYGFDHPKCGFDCQEYVDFTLLHHQDHGSHPRKNGYDQQRLRFEIMS